MPPRRVRMDGGLSEGSRPSRVERLALVAVSIDPSIQSVVLCKISVGGLPAREVVLDPKSFCRLILKSPILILPTSTLTILAIPRPGIRFPFVPSPAHNTRSFSLDSILALLGGLAESSSLKELEVRLKVTEIKDNGFEFDFELFKRDDGRSVRIDEIRVETADILRFPHYFGIEICADGEVITEHTIKGAPDSFPSVIVLPPTLCLKPDSEHRLCLVRRPWPFKSWFWPFKTTIHFEPFTMAELRTALDELQPSNHQVWHSLAGLPQLSLSLRWENLTEVLYQAQQIVSSRAHILDRLGRSRAIFERLLEWGGAVAELDSRAKTIVSCLQQLHKTISGMEECDERILQLIESMLHFMSYIEQLEDIQDAEHLGTRMQTIAPEVKEVANFVRQYETQGPRLFAARGEMARYEKLEKRFKRWTATFLNKLGVDAYIKVKSIERIFREQSDLLNKVGYDILNRIRPEKINRSRPIDPCLPGTRVRLLQEIQNWIQDANAPNILWVKGYPGSGKTCLARSTIDLCKKLRPGVNFGAAVFVERDKADMTAVSTIIRDLSAQLGQQEKFRAALMRQTHLGSADFDPAITSIADLFVCLLEAPLRAMAREGASPPLVVVIDALDECGGLDGPTREEDLGQFLQALRGITTLPSSIRFIVTSRDENRIAYTFTADIAKIVDLQLQDSQTDVELFLHHKLEKLALRYHVPDWPSTAHVKKLSEKAAGLFVWAATLIQFIDEPNPDDKLNGLLSGRLLIRGSINKLYRLIICSAFCTKDQWEPPSSTFLRELDRLVGAIVTSTHILTRDSPLFGMLRVRQQTIDLFAEKMRPLLVLDGGAPPGCLSFKHQSFIDFLVYAEECPSEFRIRPADIRKKISYTMLDFLCNNLIFNSTKITSSRKTNRHRQQSRSRFPAELVYASQYWADTLPTMLEGTHNAILTRMWDMLQHKFLFWLEVMSLCDEMPAARQQLQRATRKFVVNGQPSPLVLQLQCFLNDALKFVGKFRRCIEKSAPHIYLSAMTFESVTTTTSQIHEVYHPLITSCATIVIPTLETFREGRQEVAAGNVFVAHDAEEAQYFEGHGDDITAVAFIQDGLIVSASYDSTIRFWDSLSGAPTLKPIDGHHLNSVSCLCVSADSTLLASGCEDGRVAVWNLTIDNAKAPWSSLQEFEAPSSATPVTAIAISPDSTIVVVGYKDGYVRFRSMTTSQRIRRAFRHGPAPRLNVTALAFVGSEYIVSASKDGTIWKHHLYGRSDPLCKSKKADDDSESNRRPFHALATFDSVIAAASGRSVYRARFSSEICESPLEKLWEANSGYVEALALHGTHLAIASESKIHLMNIDTGIELLMRPLEGHADAVLSLAFSSDGNQLVSGSARPERSIRVWDVQIHADREDGGSSLTHGGFPDGSRLQQREGWIIGKRGDRLLYVPDGWRKRLCWGRTLAVMDGRPSTTVTLRPELSGRHWCRCFKRVASHV